MKQTWRWFGPADTISIDNLLHVGVEGVVSALHHIASGEVWSVAEIKKRQGEIAKLSNGDPSGLAWDVVESLVVSEAIKTQSTGWQHHVENYKHSLRNLAACGVSTVCYNFMPILDWTRTELRWAQPDGSKAMRFDLNDFAVFDIHLLCRNGAVGDYSPSIVDEAARKYGALNGEERIALQNNIVAGLPGANENWTLEDIREQLRAYAEIDEDQLRANLIEFLQLVAPTAQELGIRLCCHPDDPPFSLLGLPRIMSTVADYSKIMSAVDIEANGITLCTGSMGVATDVDFEGFIEEWGHRVHFVHLRNTSRFGTSFENKHSFFEDAHLKGNTNMVAVISALLKEEAKRRKMDRADHCIPMRPDHGQELLNDLTSNSMPGYPLIGRMRGLAELRGVMHTLERYTHSTDQMS